MLYISNRASINTDSKIKNNLTGGIYSLIKIIFADCQLRAQNAIILAAVLKQSRETDFYGKADNEYFFA